MSISPYVLHNISGQYLCVPTARLQHTSIKLPMFSQKNTQSNLLIFNTQELALNYLNDISNYHISDIGIWNNDKNVIQCPVYKEDNNIMLMSDPLSFESLHQTDVTRMFLFSDWMFFLVTNFSVEEHLLSIQGIRLSTTVEMTDKQHYHMCIHELCRYNS